MEKQDTLQFHKICSRSLSEKCRTVSPSLIKIFQPITAMLCKRSLIIVQFGNTTKEASGHTGWETLL